MTPVEGLMMGTRSGDVDAGVLTYLMDKEHLDSAGVANSFWPRNVVVFGVPVACVLLNLISGFTVSQKENAKPYMYYIMAVVAFVATGIMIYLGMK